jgi:hypothetical protein
VHPPQDTARRPLGSIGIDPVTEQLAGPDVTSQSRQVPDNLARAGCVVEIEAIAMR